MLLYHKHEYRSHHDGHPDDDAQLLQRQQRLQPQALLLLDAPAGPAAVLAAAHVAAVQHGLHVQQVLAPATAIVLGPNSVGNKLSRFLLKYGLKFQPSL